MNKLNSQPPAVTWAELAEAFAECGEDLERDISTVRVSLVRDVHFDDLEATVAVFSGDPDVEPPVAELRLAPEAVGADPERDEGAADPARVAAAFDPDVLAAMARRGVPIVWNHGDATEAVLDPSDPAGWPSRLLPMDQ